MTYIWGGYYTMLVYYKPTTAHRTFIITIPKGYDGLAVQVNPYIEGPSAHNDEYNVFDNEAEEYILDDWREGSVLMRVSDLYNVLNN